MTNEEKILSTLEKMQGDLNVLRDNLAPQLETDNTDAKLKAQMAEARKWWREFRNTPKDEEYKKEANELAEFLEYEDRKENLKLAIMNFLDGVTQKEVTPETIEKFNQIAAERVAV